MKIHSTLLRAGICGAVATSTILTIAIAQKGPATGYGMAGCGLGSLIITENSKVQILAATSNASSYNQTFGITTGTSNCTTTSAAAALQRQEAFVAANYHEITKDMARGTGPSLTGLLDTMGCAPEVQPAAGAALKSDFSGIIRAPGAMAVLDSTRDRLRAEPTVAIKCEFI